MKKALLYITTLCLAWTCVYPYDVDITTDVADILVVEGTVILGGSSEVNLRGMEKLNGEKNTIPLGTVWLESEGGKKYDGIKKATGSFVIDTKSASPSEKYRLRIESKGQTYTTDWISAPESPTLKEINFLPDNSSVNVALSFNAGESGYGYAAVSFQEIWYFHADYMKELYYDDINNKVKVLMNPDDTYYYCWKKQSSSEESYIDYSSMNGEVHNWVFWSFLRNNNRNHGDYNIKVAVRNLTAEEFRYRKQLEENTNMDGNLFTPQPGEVPSNVFCETDPSVQVFGYVNISQVSTLVAHLGNDYYINRYPGGLLFFDSTEWLVRYMEGYEPIQYIDTDEGFQPGWGKARCYNCVAAGGKQEKPEFDL